MTTDTAVRTLCTFRLADLHLGIEVTEVQEVVKGQDITRIPLVSPVLAGLINLRGEIVTAIDLRRRMGLPPAPAGITPMNVIIRSGDGAFSLLVDEIDDVVEADPADFEPPPPTLNGVHRTLVTGVFKLDDGLLLLLDLDRVLDPAEIASAPEPAAAPAHANGQAHRAAADAHVDHVDHLDRVEPDHTNTDHTNTDKTSEATS
jgi:purine-binding chemotaxis protein CheW